MNRVILGLVLASAVGRVATKVLADGKITVGEVVEAVGEVISELGVAEKVIYVEDSSARK